MPGGLPIERHADFIPNPATWARLQIIFSVSVGDVLTIIGIVVGVGGVWFTWYGVYRGNRNSSAASLIDLNEAWRQAWERYLSAEGEEAKQYQFAELLNILEISCALKIKRVFTGISRELLTEYLDSSLTLLNGNNDAKYRMGNLTQCPNTFKYVARYLKMIQNRGSA